MTSSACRYGRRCHKIDNNRDGESECIDIRDNSDHDTFADNSFSAKTSGSSKSIGSTHSTDSCLVNIP